jgi:hypothetical protein
MFSDKERDYHLPKNDAIKMNFTSRIADKWRQHCIQAKNISMAHIHAMKGKIIPLACLPTEVETLPPRLNRLFVNFSWNPMPITDIAETHETLPRDALNTNQVHRRLSDLPVFFLSPAAERKFDYLFDVFGGENVVFLSGFFPSD